MVELDGRALPFDCRVRAASAGEGDELVLPFEGLRVIAVSSTRSASRPVSCSLTSAPTSCWSSRRVASRRGGSRPFRSGRGGCAASRWTSPRTPGWCATSPARPTCSSSPAGRVCSTAMVSATSRWRSKSWTRLHVDHRVRASRALRRRAGVRGFGDGQAGCVRDVSADDSDAEVPPFVTAPFAVFSASQLAIHGTLAALHERHRSGHGQHVEVDLAQSFLSLDTWAWMEHVITKKWPGPTPLPMRSMPKGGR